MKRLAALASFALVACAPVPDYAPADINFAETEITSGAQAYDLFLNSAYSAAVASNLAAECPSFGYDNKEEQFLRDSFSTRLKTYFSVYPDELSPFIRRLTNDRTVRTVADLDRDAPIELSNEVLTDLEARLRAYFAARDIDVLQRTETVFCAAANFEKQSGSLIGRFLFRE